MARSQKRSGRTGVDKKNDWPLQGLSRGLLETSGKKCGLGQYFEKMSGENDGLDAATVCFAHLHKEVLAMKRYMGKKIISQSSKNTRLSETQVLRTASQSNRGGELLEEYYAMAGMQVPALYSEWHKVLRETLQYYMAMFCKTCIHRTF